MAESQAPLDLSQVDPSEVDYVAPNLEEAQYGGIGQQALAGLEAAGRGGTFGLSTAAEVQSGLTTPEAIRGRERANPITSFIGTGAGATALGALTGGFGGLAGGAEASLGRKVLGTAAEGALFGAGNVVSDAALGDANLNAQKILTDIGFGAAIGGGIGAFSKALGALPAMFRRGPKNLGEELAPGTVSPEQALADEGLSPPSLEATPDLKPNANEIIAAGKTLGTETPSGLLFANESDQRAHSALITSPDPTGVALSDLYNRAYKSASKGLEGVFGETGNFTLAQVGDKVKQIISNAFDQKYEPIKQLYNQIESIAPEIPIENTASLSSEIEGLIEEHGLIKNTPEYNFVKTFADGVDQIDSLQKLKNFRTALQRASGPETRFVSGVIKDKLDTFESSVVDNYAESLTDPVQKEAIESLSDTMGQAKAQYAAFREEMGDLGRVLWGGKKIYGFKDFLDKIDAETPERFATRLFSKNNVEALGKLNQNFPEVTNLLSQFEKSKIVNAAQVKGEFSPVKALTAVDKLPDEVKQIMFNPSELTSLNAGKLYFDNWPKNFNPSGTASALAYQDFMKLPPYAILSPKLGALKIIKDLAAWGSTFFKNRSLNSKLGLTPEQLEAMGQNADTAIKLNGIAGITNKVSQKISDLAKNSLLKGSLRSGVIGASTYLSDKEFNRITSQIKNYQNNPENLFDESSQAAQHLYNAAPNIAQGIQTSFMRQIQFLGSKIPTEPAHFPLSDWKPSPLQKAKFSKYYHSVNNPLIALQQIKSGHLSNETMEALQETHSELLQEMRSRVIENMDLEQFKKLPYFQKLSFSKFLGQPLDATMTPQAVMSNNMAFAPPPVPLNANGGRSRKSTNQKGLEKLDVSGRVATRTQQRDED